MTSPAIKGFAYFVMAGVGLFGVALMSVDSAHAQVSIGSDGVAFPDGTLQTTGIPGTYAIGDRGPAGGFVFYVTADGLHGLEAAPADQPSFVEWGCFGTAIPGADGTVIGTGASNTDDINDPVHGCTTAGIAAAVAAAYISPSGYFDWYLPSKDELDLMYDDIGPGNATDPNVGGFGSFFYWSSSEFNVNDAWSQAFFNGSQGANLKGSTVRVRSVRAF